ncbi:hypothetical protein ACFLZY_02970 [Patescibacteria group bacterium]
MIDEEYLESDFEENTMLFEPEPEDLEELQGSSAQTKTELATKILKQVHQSLGHVVELLEGEDTKEAAKHLAELITSKKEFIRRADDLSGSRVVEGVFDGQAMVGSDGKLYNVPPNYASKSRLLEGDVMKLTIRSDGSFLFKQIGPVERNRVLGKIAHDASINEFVAICDEGTFKLITASVTYFKGEPGDEAVVLIPKSGHNTWAAVENIVKK